MSLEAWGDEGDVGVEGCVTEELYEELKGYHEEVLKALNGLVLVCGRTGNSLDDFEEQAAAFRRETGVTRPGKDIPAASGEDDSHENRRAAYSAWVMSKVEAARKALADHMPTPQPIEPMRPPKAETR